MLHQALLAEFKMEAESTKKLFDAITDDVLTYKPNDFNWTIAELASHIVGTYHWWIGTLEDDIFEMSTYKYDKGDISNIASIKERLASHIADVLKIFENYPEERLMDMWFMQMHGENLMPAMPRAQVIRSFLMNHLYHHRGQLVAYLRVNGKSVPGMYGFSYEENLARQESQN